MPEWSKSPKQRGKQGEHEWNHSWLPFIDHWHSSLCPKGQKSPALKMDRNHAEIGLPLSKSIFEKEKTMSFYNPINLYKAGQFLEINLSLKAWGKHLFRLSQAICGSIMPGNTLKGLIVRLCRRLLIAGFLPSPSCKHSTIFVFQLSLFVRRL